MKVEVDIMKTKLYDISMRILKILKDAEEPVSYDIIERYTKNYKHEQLNNALRRMYQKGLINKAGHKRNYRYFLTPRGIECLWFAERTKIIENVDSYLLKIGRLD
jgi:predicted transcriptional regulator